MEKQYIQVTSWSLVQELIQEHMSMYGTNEDKVCEMIIKMIRMAEM